MEPNTQIGKKTSLGDVFLFRSTTLERMHADGHPDTRSQFVCLEGSRYYVRGTDRTLVGNVKTGVVKSMPSRIDVCSVELTTEQRDEIATTFVSYFC